VAQSPSSFIHYQVVQFQVVNQTYGQTNYTTDDNASRNTFTAQRKITFFVSTASDSLAVRLQERSSNVVGVGGIAQSVQHNIDIDLPLGIYDFFFERNASLDGFDTQVTFVDGQTQLINFNQSWGDKAQFYLNNFANASAVYLLNADPGPMLANTASPTASSTASPTSSGSPVSQSSIAAQKPHISSSVVIGICIAAAVLVVAVAGGIYYRRRKSSADGKEVLLGNHSK
jgi:hypothetical protein